ncbi:hypothetical protein B0H16DRAFT_1880928 [Mycena metata]|uniref:Uncharacterized protein n=1 Tax=Mycena metata TaxID=1033252 RepID=A0AAD7JUL9_9AGAR|nr:hypothetical protein B0H16DRAFT_1880928 [Mycena metata]
MPPAFDLKQVAKLFNDTITAIRDDAADLEALEPQAIEWLKAARYKLMRDVEAAFYPLRTSLNAPLTQPAWALNPAQPLTFSTAQVPAALAPYTQAFFSNLLALLKACGFEHCSSLGECLGLHLNVYFPAQVAAPPPPPRTQPLTLEVEDEFSRAAAGRARPGGAFGGTNFARLLAQARGDSDAAAKGSKKRRAPKKEGDDGSASKTAAPAKRRRTIGVKKEESDDEQPRLRSVTRASSAATLRESPKTRRSSRKAVKKE